MDDKAYLEMTTDEILATYSEEEICELYNNLADTFSCPSSLMYAYTKFAYGGIVYVVVDKSTAIPMAIFHHKRSAEEYVSIREEDPESKRYSINMMEIDRIYE